MAPFTHTVKKIKGAAYKNGDIDGMCKWPLAHTFVAKRILLLLWIKYNWIYEMEYFLRLSLGLG